MAAESLCGPGFHQLKRQTWYSLKATWTDNVTSANSLDHLCYCFCARCPMLSPFSSTTNARPHRARIVDDFLQANNVTRLDWPAMTPDLSCMLGTFLVELFRHAWTVTTRCKIFDGSWQKNGPESHYRLSWNSSRYSSKNTKFVSVVVIRIFDFWNTLFLTTTLVISGR